MFAISASEAKFDYKVADPSKAITDINEVHKVAFYLSKKATDW